MLSYCRASRCLPLAFNRVNLHCSSTSSDLFFKEIGAGTIGDCNVVLFAAPLNWFGGSAKVAEEWLITMQKEWETIVLNSANNAGASLYADVESNCIYLYVVLATSRFSCGVVPIEGKHRNGRGSICRHRWQPALFSIPQDAFPGGFEDGGFSKSQRRSLFLSISFMGGLLDTVSAERF
jgi:hypothetical protein